MQPWIIVGRHALEAFQHGAIRVVLEATNVPRSDMDRGDSRSHGSRFGG